MLVYQSEEVKVEVFSGSSILLPGQRTGEIRKVDRILSPLAASEVGTIRCIGLNVSASQECDGLVRKLTRQSYASTSITQRKPTWMFQLYRLCL